MASWENRSHEICRRLLGLSTFERVLDRSSEQSADSKCMLQFAGKTRLSIESSKAIKFVHRNKDKTAAILRRDHAVGAVGYAEVLDVHGQTDRHLPPNEFFERGRRFRVRFRHSNVNCDDDAASCVREASIKFADQNRDGPFDLILCTGRTSLARDCQTFAKLLRMKTRDDVKKMCRADPQWFFALVDGLRRGPSSFADLTYYSQIAYLLTPRKADHKKIVRFRLVPYDRVDADNNAEQAGDGAQRFESGMLDDKEQEHPWDMDRKAGDTRDPFYLREEFTDRLREDEPVKYRLQIQLAPDLDSSYWNPQTVWDESRSPWLDLMVIELTTSIPTTALSRTFFNVVEKPPCLQFPPAVSPLDYLGFQKVLSSVLTEFERKNVSQMTDQILTTCDDATAVRHFVKICSEPVRDGCPIPNVDVSITLAGTQSRTSPQHLNRKLETKTEDQRRIERFKIHTEPVGELLAIIIDVRHRQLTEEWYLRGVDVTDDNQTKSYRFVCHSVVQSRITLRPGEVCLVHKQLYEVHRKERLLELCDRCQEYHWAGSSSANGLPGQICNPNNPQSLPCQDRLIASKYTGMRWEVDPDLIEFFRKMTFTLLSTKASIALDQAPQSYNILANQAMKSTRSSNFNRQMSLQQNTTGNGSAITGGGMVFLKRHSLDRQCSVDFSFGGDEVDGQNPKTPRTPKGRPRLEPVDEMEGLPATSDTPSEGVDVVDGFLSPSNKASATDAAPAVGRTSRTNLFQKKARDHWKLIKHAKRFISESKIPDGAAGDMCRLVINDANFGRTFLCGSNPTIIRRCSTIPHKFPVTEEMCAGLLDRSRCLKTEAQSGYVYVADYSVLSGIETVHRDADHRYLTAPMVLLYVRANDDLIPLAIQLNQTPGPDNPIWTCRDRPEHWLLVKLWVRCADFHHQFAISHWFKCHLVMEPFIIATMRRLPAAHPVYKILKPHFRYALLTNTMIRNNVIKKGGSIDRYTSLGSDGFLELMRRCWANFDFDELNPKKDCQARRVSDERKLPNYFYRDDSIRLWDCVHQYCQDMLGHYYKSDADLDEDTEIKVWIKELHTKGFPASASDHGSTPRSTSSDSTGACQSTSSDVIDPRGGCRGLPSSFSNLPELVELVTNVMFTMTCQHSATHSDAMDLFGYVADVPAMMRQAPPTSKNCYVTRETLAKTLPDQFPDAYFATLAFIMNIHKPDQNLLGDKDEVYFVEKEAMDSLDQFQRNLKEITVKHRTRNLMSGIAYDCLVPAYIPSSPEALPYVPRVILAKSLRDLGPTMTKHKFLDAVESGTLPYNSLALPVCMQFSKMLGGRCLRGVQLTVKPFTMKSAQDDTMHATDDQFDVVDSAQPRTLMDVQSRRKTFQRDRKLSTDF